MKRQEWARLAETIVHHSLGLKRGQRVLIEVVGQAEPLVDAIVHAVWDVGAHPFFRFHPTEELRSLILHADSRQLHLLATREVERQRTMDGFIGIRADENLYEFSDLPKEQYNRYVKLYMQPLQAAMAELEKWVLLKYPTYGMAQLAKMSLSQLQQNYLAACNLDYQKLQEMVQPLAQWLEKTEHVRIVGPDTDLHFSIKGIPHYLCDGKYNLPDGEIFTAPLLESAEGKITFNVPATYMGLIFEQVSLEFRQGKVVRVRSSDETRLTELLSCDEGARQLGEFGIGLNPYIRQPMYNTLFDEKMAGSIHLALGQAYPMAENGNVSNLHLDLVLCQLPEFGGGSLFFDNVLIRKDGMFQPPELQRLNR
ncbi:aminopeptidase [Brevibacillus fulvus]|uniref:Aminopeptidase n=1 Tax=Brevibacillus fulvus TaxID=1125967 RepID=A0A938XSM3_9BACL|nr:aminopeptidase [Brevibacillus fulvus]MBM7589658.1 aminopeptidase [Brevibacillus fulvus]